MRKTNPLDPRPAILLVTGLLSGCVGSIGGGGNVTREGVTVYVDVDNNAGMEDGSEEFPFTSISRALDEARRNDTVQVAPGTYEESINLKDEVRLIGAGPAKTIITAQEVTQVVFASSSIDETSVFEGFTIASSTVENAVLFIQGAPTIGDIVLRNNSISAATDPGSETEVSVIAAVRIGGTEGTKVTKCVVVDNLMSGISVANPSGLNEISNCLVACNDGHGIVVQGRRTTLDIDALITNCTISLNTGDGVYIDQYADAQIQNCIFWKNGDNAVLESQSAGDPLMRFNDVSGGYFDTDTDTVLTDSATINALDPPGENTGNKTRNPLFVDDQAPDLDFALQTGSPLINAGDPDPTFDDADGSRNDMGASGGVDGIDNLTCTGDVTAGLLLYSGPNPSYDSISVPGPWGAVPETAASSSRSALQTIVRADLTGDGMIDRIVCDGAGRLSLVPGRNQTSRNPPREPLSPEQRSGNFLWPLADQGELARTRLTDPILMPDTVFLVDFDLDGDLDLHVPGGIEYRRDALLLNDGTGQFTEVATARGLNDDTTGRALGWIDVDGDGDEDLLTKADRTRAAYINTTATGHSVVLIPDRHAITEVRLAPAGDRSAWGPEKDRFTRIPGRQLGEIVIGLGGRQTADLEVLLEGGAVRRLRNVRAGQSITISQTRSSLQSPLTPSPHATSR